MEESDYKAMKQLIKTAIANQNTGESVYYNKFNKVVQSHGDGTIYISIFDAIEFAKNYHRDYVRSEKLNNLLN